MRVLMKHFGLVFRDSAESFLLLIIHSWHNFRDDNFNNTFQLVRFKFIHFFRDYFVVVRPNGI